MGGRPWLRCAFASDAASEVVVGGCGRLGALQMWALRTELRYIFARLLQMDVKRTSPGLSVAQGPRMGQMPGLQKTLASGRFLPSQSALPMLQAVRPGVFFSVDASCMLRLLASVLQSASAIIWREFRHNEAKQRLRSARHR